MRVRFSSGDVELRAVRRLRGRPVLRPVPDRQTVPADPGGGRGLSTARSHQAEEEPGALRLRRGALLCRRGPGGDGQKQAPGGVCAPAEAGPAENKAFWEEAEDGRGELLTVS